jgi:drug/metabolite transporter (DMT)-like permease
MAAATTKPMTTLQWAQLLVLGGLWGGSFFFARVAVAEMHPLVLVFFRVLIAAAALHLYMLARGIRFSQALPQWWALLFLSVLNNVVPFSLIFAGQTHLGAGVASVLNATTPFWTIVIANALTDDERVTWNKAAGILLGIVGTVVMIGPGLLTGLEGPAWPKFALIGAAISYGFALIWARRFRGLPPVIIAAAQLTGSAAIMLPVALYVEPSTALFTASAHVWMAVTALAVLSTAVAYILYFSIAGSAGATNASLVTLIVPVSAILLGTAILGERLELNEIAGMCLILFGLLVIDGRIMRVWLTS